MCGVRTLSSLGLAAFGAVSRVGALPLVVFLELPKQILQHAVLVAACNYYYFVRMRPIDGLPEYRVDV